MTETKMVKAGDRQSLELASEIALRGGLVAFPTDTVYGLGTGAFNQEAVERLYSVKGRSADKPIPILLADVYALEQVVQDPAAEIRLLAQAFWPGPLTMVLPKVAGLPAAISAEPTVGVRVPDHEFARALLARVGPMAVSSANRSGAAVTRTPREVMAQLSGRVELVVDGGISPGGEPSTVISFSDHGVQILRQGPISHGEIERVLGG